MWPLQIVRYDNTILDLSGRSQLFGFDPLDYVRTDVEKYVEVDPL